MKLNNKSYFIWKKDQKDNIMSDEFNQTLQKNFYDGKELNCVGITYYSEWHDDHNKIKHYVKRRVKTGYKEVMADLPWSDEPSPAREPTFEDRIEEFEYSSDAMKYIYRLLSEENNVTIEDSLHLLEEADGVYRIQDKDEYEQLYNSSDIITLTYSKLGGMLVFDSELENSFKLKCSFKQYLSQRDTLVQAFDKMFKSTEYMDDNL